MENFDFSLGCMQAARLVDCNNASEWNGNVESYGRAKGKKKRCEMYGDI